MSNPPVFTGINLVVAEMDATVAFYRLLGVEIPDTDPQWEDDHRTAVNARDAGLELDSAASVSLWDKGWTGSRMGVLGFAVTSRDEVDAVFIRMTDAGYRAEQPPFDAFWGARYAIVQDPDGNAVGIMSPIDDAYRRDPSTS